MPFQETQLMQQKWERQQFMTHGLIWSNQNIDGVVRRVFMEV